MATSTVPVSKPGVAADSIAGECADCLTNNLGWLLSQASYAYSSELAAALEPLGLGQRGVCVLASAVTGEFTQTQLAHAIGLDKTMMMVTLDELEKLGLAERRRSARDRRAHIVAVTRAGKAKLAEAQAIIERVQEVVLGTLPQPQRDAFFGGLVQLVTGRLAEPPECGTPVRRPRA
jgi:MarR family transcriptional regulator, transcriptional regulator for hemolysin